MRIVASLGVVGVGLVGLIVACGDARVGQVRQALIDAGIGDAAFSVVAPAGGNGSNEPSAVWSWTTTASGGRVPTFVVGSNGAPNRWGYSLDQGVTWTACNVGIVACTGGVALDAGTYPLGDGGTANVQFKQDSALTTDGAGHVVYIGMVQKAENPDHNAISAMVSIDGGQTFRASSFVRVTDPGAQDCYSGDVDQPHAAFDMTTSPPTLWVVWRYNGAGTDGGCVRRGVLDASNNYNIKWLDRAWSVGNMWRVSTFGGQGGLRIAAGEGAVTVVYAAKEADNACPQTDFHGMGYGSTTSFDNGAHWTDETHIFKVVDENGGDNFQPCVLNGGAANTGTVWQSFRSFDFVRAPDGNYYFAGVDTRDTVRLFTSRANAHSTKSSSTTTNGWREWCPGHGFNPGQPRSNWTPPGAECPGVLRTSFRAPVATVRTSVAMPSIAVDDHGRLGLWYYESNGDPSGGADAGPDTLLNIRFQANPAPRDPTSTFVPSALLRPEGFVPVPATLAGC